MIFNSKLIPWKYLSLWLGIILIEVILIFGLDFYQKSLQDKIYDFENQISVTQRDLSDLLQNSEYLKTLGQYLGLKEILNQRVNISELLDSFASQMPKDMSLDSLNIDVEKRLMDLRGTFSSWQDYLQAVVYFRNNTKFKLEDQGNPLWQDDKVRFNWKIKIQ